MKYELIYRDGRDAIYEDVLDFINRNDIDSENISSNEYDKIIANIPSAYKVINQK